MTNHVREFDIASSQTGRDDCDDYARLSVPPTMRDAHHSRNRQRGNNAYSPYWVDMPAAAIISSVECHGAGVPTRAWQPAPNGAFHTFPPFENPFRNQTAREMCQPPSNLNTAAPPFVPNIAPVSTSQVDSGEHAHVNVDYQWPGFNDNAGSNYAHAVPTLDPDDDDAVWSDMEDVPPTTIEEGLREARTLAIWGTIPYTIVDGMFCSEQSYPLVMEVVHEPRGGVTLDSNLSTLLRAQSEEPFTLTVGCKVFGSAKAQQSDGCIVEVVDFQHGLPLFKLTDSWITVHTWSRAPEIILFGEVYDMLTIYAMIPNNVKIPVRAFTSQTTVIQNGLLHSEGADANASDQYRELQSSSSCVDTDTDESNTESSAMDDEDTTFEDSIREYYANLPLREFLDLSPSMQEQVRTMLLRK